MLNFLSVVSTVVVFFFSQLEPISTQDVIDCDSELRALSLPLTIQSPNYPDNYTNNLNCRIHITSPEGTVIELNFIAFDLEESTLCQNDALVVFDGLDGGMRLLQHSCGSDFVWPHYPSKVVSSGNQITLEFVTDGSGTSTGYSATYQAVEPRPYIFIVANPEDNKLRVFDRHSARNFRISPENLQLPLSVDYDPPSGFVFYTDKDAENIGRINIDSLQTEILHSQNVKYPFGLRVDVISRLLYWTDTDLGTVSVSDLEGNYRLTIIENGLKKPGSIVIEPHHGYIYFTDQGSPGKILKAEADGSNLEILVAIENSHPQGLAIDLQERMLYWIDPLTDNLETISTEGNNSRSLRLHGGIDPFAIVLDNDAMFITDSTRGGITIYERTFQTAPRGIAFADITDYRGLTLRPLYDFGEENEYACSSSPCNEICLPKPERNFTCKKVLPEFTKACPTDYLKTGTGGLNVTWEEPNVTSPQGLAITHTQTHYSGQYFDPGAYLVNYDFEDTLGNKVLCTFYVVVIGSSGIFCPDDVEVFVEEGATFGRVTWYEPINSMGELAVTNSHSPGDLFPLGQTIVTYIFDDNSDVCTFTVTVTDDHQVTEVFANCPDSILKWVAPAQTSARVTWNKIELANPGYQISIETEIPGDKFYVGIETVYVLAVGPLKRKAWCNFTVTVKIDNVPPDIFGCPSTITRVASPDSSSVDVTWIEPTVSDNSGSVYWESKPAEPGSTFRVGVTNLTYVASDGYGNKATCSFLINISEADDGNTGPGETDARQGNSVVITLFIVILVLIFIFCLTLIVIIRYKRSRRRVPPQDCTPPPAYEPWSNHGPITSPGGQLTFISGDAVNFQAPRLVENTNNVINNDAMGAMGPPPPYEEKDNLSEKEPVTSGCNQPMRAESLYA